MKIVNYSRLNPKNKARIDSAIAEFGIKPTIAHHSTVSTRSTKFVRSLVTVSNPATELNLVIGGRIKVTQVNLEG